MKTMLVVLLALGWFAASAAWAAKVPRDVLGIRIGMSEEAAEERLERLGGTRGAREEEGEREAGELWTIRHPRFAYVYLAVDEARRVESVQAFARANAPRSRFRDLGDVKKAKTLGFYIVQWTVPGRDGQPGRIVTARSDDSVYVASLSLQSNGRVPERERDGDPEREREREAAARR